MSAPAHSTPSSGIRPESFGRYSKHAAFRLAVMMGFLTTLLGLAVLVGWTFDIALLKTLLPGYVTMKVNTAICFILCGASLIIGYLSRPRPWKKTCSTILAAIVAVIASLTLVEYLSGQSLGLDQFLFRDDNSVIGTFTPGRMAPNSATVFFFYAAALALLRRGRAGALAAQILAVAGMCIALLAFIGYLFNAQVFIGILSVTRVALHTIVGFWLFGVGMLCARPGRGLTSAVLADSPGGLIARGLIGPAIITPIVVGWVAFQGLNFKLYDVGFACSLIVFTSMAVICILTTRSILELNRIEYERRRLSEARLEADVRERGAVEASRLKSEFVANVSHEIRTPMNGVLGMTSLLLDSELTGDQREHIETIRQSGDALLTLVNEILDFSKMEAGKVTLESKPFLLAGCVDDVINLLAVTARRNRVDLISYIDSEVPPMFLGDATRLRQVLLNLVGNALKFTEEGEVALEVSRTRREDGAQQLSFLISDTGQGISPDSLPLLFRPFQQGDASATRRHGGTGLGLTISKRLVELMGGEITVSSIVSTGSVFRFTIPLAVAAPETGNETEARLPASTRIVLVAKGRKYPGLLKAQIEAWGASVAAVAEPMAMMEMEKGAYAAVLMDRNEATVALAAQMQFDPDWNAVPRVLLDFGEPLTAERAALFARRITKPVKRSQLQAALFELTGTTQPVPQRITGPLPPPMAKDLPLRLLLAEDNRINQKVGLALLTRLGYKADVANNGLEALQAVLRNTYDLVLLDIQMPEMDGVEAAQAMRKKLGDKCPLLAAVTANAFPGAREEYLSKGFDDYLSKPLLPEPLRNLITRMAASRKLVN